MTQPSSGARHDTGHGPGEHPARHGYPAGPGVPLSVWPGLPVPSGSQDGPACGGSVTQAAAAQIIESFSRPGDLVAVAGELPAAAEAAAAGRDAASLAPGGRGPVPAGQAALAIAGHCGPGCCAAGHSDDDGGLLYATCERALRPGVLAVVIAGPGADPDSGLAGSSVAAARAVALAYAQHIVLVHAAIDGDRLDPGGPSPGRPAASPGGVRAHSDLLVFTKPGGIQP
jgi:hypothetical protein